MKSSTDQIFSPFPKEDEPIFNYNLAEAVNGSNERLTEMGRYECEDRLTKEEIRNILCPNGSYLTEMEIDFFRNKIGQLISQREKEGFTLYDTKDEEGLHEAQDQDDYDIDEIEDDENYAFDIPPNHHIEVELNTSDKCDAHYDDCCNCPMYSKDNDDDEEYEDEDIEEDDDDDDYEDDNEFTEGPSCEFTFEYDSTGKLIPTYNNIEEKIKLMKLEAKMNEVNEPKNQKKMKLPSMEPKSVKSPEVIKKKKNKKRIPKQFNVIDDLKSMQKELVTSLDGNSTGMPPNKFRGFIPSNQCCLLCQYEAIYGEKPYQMLKKIYREEKRRQEFKKKLQSAKSKAMRKQKENRQKSQKQQPKSKQQQKLQPKQQQQQKHKHEEHQQIRKEPQKSKQPETK